MLSYLPKPYDDELLYSIVARYFTHVGGARGSIVEQLFGRRGVRAQVDLPSSLGRFAENAAALWGLTAEEIAERYTLLPYYTYYANVMLKKRAMEAVKSDSG
ncbi:MAG TPA: TniQ family protein, partial [Rhodothermales bacterium]